MPPPNTYWVVQDKLLAGEYPGDEQPALAMAKLGSLLDSGIRAFLDLTESRELQHYESGLVALQESRGMHCAYRRIPVRDARIPQSPAIMREILTQIATWVAEGRGVYVHCWGGVGRTGTVTGCALVERGLNGEQALARLGELWLGMSEEKRRRHPETPETPAQRDYILGWQRSMGGSFLA